MKARPGKCVSIAAVYMECPRCGSGEVAAVNDGSLMVTHDGVDWPEAKCLACGQAVRVPAWVARNTGN